MKILGQQLADLRHDLLAELLESMSQELHKRNDAEFFIWDTPQSIAINEVIDHLKTSAQGLQEAWLSSYPTILKTIPQDIIEYVSKNFTEKQQESLMLTYSLCAEHEDSSFRLARCALFASRNSWLNLQDMLADIWHYPMDVIYLAEYNHSGQRLRNFNQPFGKEYTCLDEVDFVKLILFSENDELPF